MEDVLIKAVEHRNQTLESLDRRLDRLDKLCNAICQKIEKLSLPQQTALLMKIEDASLQTGYKVSYIYHLVRDNKIPHVKLGRSIRFDMRELDA